MENSIDQIIQIVVSQISFFVEKGIYTEHDIKQVTARIEIIKSFLVVKGLQS